MMLTEFLTLLSNPDTLSLTELARQAGYTPDEVAAGLEQLARMGYIERQEIGQACGVCSGGRHCDTCSVAGTAEPFPSWHLTEKGNQYLSKRKRAER